MCYNGEKKKWEGFMTVLRQKAVNYSATSSRASCFNDSGYYHISYYYEQLSPRLHKLME